MFELLTIPVRNTISWKFRQKQVRSLDCDIQEGDTLGPFVRADESIDGPRLASGPARRIREPLGSVLAGDRAGLLVVVENMPGAPVGAEMVIHSRDGMGSRHVGEGLVAVFLGCPVEHIQVYNS